MKHLLHHVKTRVSLVIARDAKPKLLVDVDRCLQVFMLIFLMLINAVYKYMLIFLLLINAVHLHIVVIRDDFCGPFTLLSFLT